MDLTPDGTFTNLLNLNGAASNPSTLIQASDGNFYGASEGASTLFKITPTGTLTTIYTFDGVDGSERMNMLYEGLKQNSTIVIVPSSAIETMQLGGPSWNDSADHGIGPRTQGQRKRK